MLVDQPGLVDLVGDLGDDDRLALRFLLGLNVGLGADLDDAAAGGVGVPDPLAAVDDGAGREVRTGHQRQQLFEADLRVVDHGDDAVDHLHQVVGRYVGGHADGDAGGAVDQQVGKLGGEDRRLQQLVVVVGRHADGFLVQVGQELVGELAQADLGVTHGCRRIAVHRTEVALAVHQHVAQREVLGHAHDGVVGRRIAMGVVLADHVADDAGRFLVGLVVVVAHVVHGVQAAPVHRLEPVAHVRQGAADDDRHGVVHVGTFHFVFDVDGNLGLRCGGSVEH